MCTRLDFCVIIHLCWSIFNRSPQESNTGMKCLYPLFSLKITQNKPHTHLKNYTSSEVILHWVPDVQLPQEVVSQSPLNTMCVDREETNIWSDELLYIKTAEWDTNHCWIPIFVFFLLSLPETLCTSWHHYFGPLFIVLSMCDPLGKLQQRDTERHKHRHDFL